MRRGPRGSEVPVGEWLRQIGCTDIEYVGEEEEGPPDYVARFHGDEVAIEATLLHDHAWPEEVRRSFERELREVIERHYADHSDTCLWHVVCEFDPAEAGPPRLTGRKGRRARDRVARALRGEESPPVQLLPEDDIRGWGVTLELLPASESWSLQRVESGEGSGVAQALTARVVGAVQRKTERREKGRRADRYDRWWLVLDDEILIAPKELLGPEERGAVEERVRACSGRGRWSKIVLVSRFQTSPLPPKTPKWFWPLWEHPGDPPLPRS